MEGRIPFFRKSENPEGGSEGGFIVTIDHAAELATDLGCQIEELFRLIVRDVATSLCGDQPVECLLKFDI